MYNTECSRLFKKIILLFLFLGRSGRFGQHWNYPTKAKVCYSWGYFLKLFIGKKNSNENIVKISALKFFASWGLPGGFFGLPGDLASNIINKEAYRKSQKAPRRPQGSYKEFQGRNSYNTYFRSYFGRNDDAIKTFKKLIISLSRFSTHFKLETSTCQKCRRGLKKLSTPLLVEDADVFVIKSNRRPFFFPETENLNFGDLKLFRDWEFLKVWKLRGM